eukprot:6107019-Prymnesium_polylepis.1
MPTEYLDRATAIAVGQHWKASDLLASLRDMRYERAMANPGRGEYLWSSASNGDNFAGSGAATKHALSVHLIHEDRILEVGLQRVGEDGGYGYHAEDDSQLVVHELRYRDVGSGRGAARAETSAAAGAAEALIKAVLNADSSPPILSKTEIRSLKVAELREACGERSLDTEGLKPTLAVRLKEHEARRGRSSASDGVSKDGTMANVAFSEDSLSHVVLYPASHYTAGQEEQRARVLDAIATECASAVDALLANGQTTEAERL